MYFADDSPPASRIIDRVLQLVPLTVVPVEKVVAPKFDLSTVPNKVNSIVR
jgi:hypothetical protein